MCVCVHHTKLCACQQFDHRPISGRSVCKASAKRFRTALKHGRHNLCVVLSRSMNTAELPSMIQVSVLEPPNLGPSLSFTLLFSFCTLYRYSTPYLLRASRSLAEVTGGDQICQCFYFNVVGPAYVYVFHSNVKSQLFIFSCVGLITQCKNGGHRRHSNKPQVV